MDAKTKGMLINHYDVIAAFNEDYYKDLITKTHLGEETVIKIHNLQEFVYPVKYKGKIYAIPSKIVEKGKLPIKITGSEKIAFNRNVYHYVKKFASARIIEEKTMSFRQLMDAIADFEHSNKNTDFLIHKIASVMLYLRKGFIREVSEAAFGKNSILSILKSLMADIAIINPRSAAAFEHKLINNHIVLDELTNLENAQRSVLQDVLLQIADGSSSYEKGTRGNSKIGTKDEYNISKLSIQVMYNIYQYYVNAGQGDKYFDNVFTFAVKDRFLPLYLEGTLNSLQFIHIDKPKQMANRLKEDIKKIIRALKYFQKNLEKEDKGFKLYKSYILSKSGRIDKTFHVICQGLRLYANDEKEYNKLVELLYKMHKKYLDMMCDTEIQEELLDEKNGQTKIM